MIVINRAYPVNAQTRNLMANPEVVARERVCADIGHRWKIDYLDGRGSGSGARVSCMQCFRKLSAETMLSAYCRDNKSDKKAR